MTDIDVAGLRAKADKATLRLRKMSVAIYIAVEQSVADDISDGLREGANVIDALRAALEAAEGKVTDLEANVAFTLANASFTIAEVQSKRQAAELALAKAREDALEDAAEVFRKMLPRTVCFAMDAVDLIVALKPIVAGLKEKGNV